MIFCPSCRHREPFGTIFCSECGAQLHFLEATGVAASRPQPKPHQTNAPAMPDFIGDSSPLQERAVALRMIDSSVTLPLEPGEHTLGRTTGQQPILPDIDLTPYQAYQEGVSRLHATIKVAADEISITDLGSVNGTYVNGKKLPAHQPRILQEGDTILLGKLKMQILIHR